VWDEIDNEEALEDEEDLDDFLDDLKEEVDREEDWEIEGEGEALLGRRFKLGALPNNSSKSLSIFM
jgi:hypothetical protein